MMSMEMTLLRKAQVITKGRTKRRGGDNKGDGIIGLQDISKIFQMNQEEKEKYPNIYYVKRSDGTTKIFEVRRAIF